MILAELKRLLADAATPPDVNAVERKDPMYRAGYAQGFTDGVEEAIEIVEEEEV